MAHKNILVLGNGFDLCLGMKSRYSDFANSKYWPIKLGKDITSNLFRYLYDYTQKHTDAKDLNRVNWIDLEQALVDYVENINVQLEELKPDDVLNDKRDFNLLKSRFSDYLQQAQLATAPQYDFNPSVNLIKAIYNNGSFSPIYNFNYTDFETISSRYVTNGLKSIHIHGSLKDRDIILGINERQSLPDEYSFLFKSSDPDYKSNNLIGDLMQAEECVFFGMSFGAIDNIYFSDFFKSVPTENSIDNNRKKHITIFTYDEISRESIEKNIRDMGVSIQTLKTHVDLTYIKIAELGNNERNANRDSEFFKRIASNNRDVQQSVVTSSNPYDVFSI